MRKAFQKHYGADDHLEAIMGGKQTMAGRSMLRYAIDAFTSRIYAVRESNV